MSIISLAVSCLLVKTHQPKVQEPRNNYVISDIFFLTPQYWFGIWLKYFWNYVQQKIAIHCTMIPRDQSFCVFFRTPPGRYGWQVPWMATLAWVYKTNQNDNSVIITNCISLYLQQLWIVNAVSSTASLFEKLQETALLYPARGIQEHPTDFAWLCGHGQR